jgi:hypothetical protein
VDPWESQQLGDVEMIAVPFRGEQDEPDATIDHYTYDQCPIVSKRIISADFRTWGHTV